MKKKIFFIAGTKGGVGKSTFAIYLASAAMDQGQKVLVFDSDSENKTLVNLIPGTRFLDDDKNSYPLDPTINIALDSDDDSEIIVVDMKAGTSRTAQEWFTEVPFDLLKDYADIYLVCCVTSDPDSVRTINPWTQFFGEKGIRINYVLVKNAKDGSDFSIYDLMLSAKMKKLNAFIISYPAIDNQYQTDLNKSGLLLRDVVSGTKQLDGYTAIMQRSRFRRFYIGYTDPLKELLSK